MNGAKKFVRLYELMVPCARNDGTPYRTRHHREWDRQVREITGGMTIMQPARGQWKSDTGELYMERMIPVRIACTEDQMNEILKRTLNHYPDQEAIMAYIVSEKVIIKKREA